MSTEKGLFWVPGVKVKRGKKRILLKDRPMPKIKSKWRALSPADWPNYRHAKTISIDTETYDPNLLTHGPFWARGDGHLVGISAAVSKTESIYLPMRHEVKKKQNCDPDKVLLWAKDNLTNPETLIIGANITYDVGGLREEGVHIAGRLLDVQHVEALINEHRMRYDLDSLAKRYLKEGKVSDRLYQWLAEYYGGQVNGKQRANIYRAPASLVGPYAEGDAYQPFQIWERQKGIIKEQQLERVLDLECRLIPLLIDMRFRGVRVDLEKAEQVREQLIESEAIAQKRLNKVAGVEVAVNAAATIVRAFKKNNLAYPLTKKGNPSFTKIFLENNPSEIAKLIVEIRGVSKLRSTFIEGAILGKNVKGRIHCEFTQLKGDSGGAITGRFASRNPNLQNIPARHKIYAPLIRGCFIPDEGYSDWLKTDASQIEYRGLAHYAVGNGADGIRRLYNDVPDTDYHQSTIDLIQKITGQLLDRKPAKSINFGICYGMGKAKLQKNLGLTTKAAKELMLAYHAGVPFVKATFDACVEQAQQYGYIKTIMGRRARFEKWEEPWGEFSYTYEEAVELFGSSNIQRAYTHKALNSLLQGSAADFMKKLMVDTYEAGIFDALGGAPHITVHDELSISTNFEDDSDIIRDMIYTMQDCLPMKVPLLMDTEVGSSWGTVEEIEL